MPQMYPTLHLFLYTFFFSIFIFLLCMNYWFHKSKKLNFNKTSNLTKSKIQLK
uniref:ATP synthase F0 subunit 8 n=1 Tax=Piagetiella africana TaxID=2965260 RepID=UPI00286A0B97|nr:ATP synthase F0 subunit 8 [Piagetiella africana]WKF19577.1 ATP synthase subunit 8 [Piagetiella africana]